MPRPKVKPEDRQRSSKACLPCKTSKIRCDSQLPCVACVRRDRASQCVYQDTPGRRIPGRARDGAATYRPRNPASQSRSRLSPSPEHENPYTSPVSTNDALASPPELPGSQMMMSAKGEKGESKLLSIFVSFYSISPVQILMRYCCSLRGRDGIAVVFAFRAPDIAAVYGPIGLHGERNQQRHARGRH